MTLWKVNEEELILVKFVENKKIPSRDFVCEAPSFNITPAWEVIVEVVVQKTSPYILSHSSIETCSLRICLDWSKLGSSNEDTFVKDIFTRY